MQLIFRLFLTAVLLSICGTAYASTITYQYQGPTLDYYSGTPYAGPTYPGFSGIMTIDEALLGRSLASTSASFVIHGPPLVEHDTPPWLLDFTVFYQGIIYTKLAFTTDENKNIVSWQGELFDAYQDGTISSTLGDVWDIAPVGRYLSPDPGVWQIAEVSGDPLSAVPVPAAIAFAPILFFLGLPAFRRRRGARL